MTEFKTGIFRRDTLKLVGRTPPWIYVPKVGYRVVLASGGPTCIIEAIWPKDATVEDINRGDVQADIYWETATGQQHSTIKLNMLKPYGMAEA